jgi:hypothetical protein
MVEDLAQSAQEGEEEKIIGVALIQSKLKELK